MWGRVIRRVIATILFALATELGGRRRPRR